MKCGVNLTSTSGTIFSPGFEVCGQCDRSEDCDWYIIPQKENSSVLIQFRSFATHMYDSLTVYCDPPTYRTSAATYVESQIPYDRLFEGPLRLHFTSSKYLWDGGFSLDCTIIEGANEFYHGIAYGLNFKR